MEKKNQRKIVLDTETTGMNTNGPHYKGHRIIEIGAVEISHRDLTGNNFHIYLNPERLVDPKAFSIHGISDEFLSDKPKFYEIADEFLSYIKNSELIIHNAFFDISFIDYEFEMLKRNIGKSKTFCKITDTLSIARKIYPGKKNSLNALCSRLSINTSKRALHGALLDSELLAEVFLLLTEKQSSFNFSEKNKKNIIKQIKNTKDKKSTENSLDKIYINKMLPILKAKKKKKKAHELYLDLLIKKGKCIWRS